LIRKSASFFKKYVWNSGGDDSRLLADSGEGLNVCTLIISDDDKEQDRDKKTTGEDRAHEISGLAVRLG